MVQMHIDEQVGEAWLQHRMGNHPAAIQVFEDILNKRPDHLDALYGLGLARRANGEKDWAIEAFKKALNLTNEALAAVDKTAYVDGNHGNNDLSSYSDDRYLMLSRMIMQRLEELDS